MTIEAARRGGGYACLCNVHVLESAHRDPALMAVLRGATLVFPDGAPIAWVQRRAAGRHAERVGGPDLMDRVLQDGVPLGLRHALYGSSEGTLSRLVSSLEARHPGLRIVAAIAPPFDRGLGVRPEDLDALTAARPDVVWVALGAPRQELWAASHADALAPALLVGVGAAFDFLAGTKPRAPRWMRRTGTEWLHRLATEPRRLGGRYVRTNTRFVARVFAETVRRARRRTVEPTS